MPLFHFMFFICCYRMKLITNEMSKYRAGVACAPMHFFKVTYNKHTLTLDDLSTLDDQNWVNDQVGLFKNPYLYAVYTCTMKSCRI